MDASLDGHVFEAKRGQYFVLGSHNELVLAYTSTRLFLPGQQWLI